MGILDPQLLQGFPGSVTDDELYLQNGDHECLLLHSDRFRISRGGGVICTPTYFFSQYFPKYDVIEVLEKLKKMGREVEHASLAPSLDPPLLQGAKVTG